MSETYTLLRPEHAWTAVVPIALAAVAWFGLARRARDRARLAGTAHIGRLLPAHSSARAAARVALASAAALLLFVSLLGPVAGFTNREVVRRGLDIVVCLDTSRSMLAQDLRPDRLTRAVREVVGLLDGLEGDRVALVAFSGDARDVAPLTHDRSALEALLRRVSTDDNQVGGTDLGAAISYALELFDGATGAHEAICLLTDGEDLEGRGFEAAERAAELGIRVYVVGIGTLGGGKIPTVLPDGREAFQRGPDGEEVVTRLEGESLAALARATGGEYLSTEDSPTPLEELYAKRISRLDRRDVAGGIERVPHDRYQITLGLAILCMILEAALRERRAVPR